MNKYKLGIFDLSGTLTGYDSKFECLQTIKIFKFFGLNLSRKEVKEYLKMDICARQKRRTRLGITEEQFFNQWNSSEILREKVKHLYCYEDVSFLQQIISSNLKIALISNTPTSLAETEIELVKKKLNCWPFKWFISLNSPESIFPKKPATEAIFECMSYFGCNSRESFVIGDNDEDILFGKNANITTVWLNRGRHSIRYAPDYKISSLGELAMIIKIKNVQN